MKERKNGEDKKKCSSHKKLEEADDSGGSMCRCTLVHFGSVGECGSVQKQVLSASSSPSFSLSLCHRSTVRGYCTSRMKSGRKREKVVQLPER